METPHYPTTDGQSKISRFLDRFRFLIAGILLLLIAVTALMMMRPKTEAKAPAGKAYDTYEGATKIESVETLSTPTAQLAIDIAGAVRAPGVYYLASGSIVNAAIEAAGGLASNADIDYIYEKINRAALLEDHSKVFIPRIGQSALAAALPATASTPSYIAPAQGTANTDTVININSDPASKLEELPGIGQVLAKRIADYRTVNGPFAKIEDIKNVPGIGDSLFEKIKDQIMV